jgi:hypothetical protein
MIKNRVEQKMRMKKTASRLLVGGQRRRSYFDHELEQEGKRIPWLDGLCSTHEFVKGYRDNRSLSRDDPSFTILCLHGPAGAQSLSFCGNKEYYVFANIRLLFFVC